GTLNGCPVNTLIFQKSTIDAKHSHAPPHPNWTSGQVDIVLGFSFLLFFSFHSQNPAVLRHFPSISIQDNRLYNICHLHIISGHLSVNYPCLKARASRFAGNNLTLVQI
ncbi:MAG: hypothetical protein IKE94_08430, partial [Aeriscardovia sp.]|nr:hypothetical protein [Aeriscardovia sp.]